mmetsp:Transcript_17879/g.50690  ORF Transcript_17879/g.50690 Transcript_17879/m.50690 type:complete len:179 (+) Transcript_17879:205-741(+)
MSVPAWKLRLQMQGKDIDNDAKPAGRGGGGGGGSTGDNQNGNGRTATAQLPRELQVNRRANESQQQQQQQPNDDDPSRRSTAHAKTNSSAPEASTGIAPSAHAGPKEQERPEFAYRAPEDNIKKSFEPKKWEKQAFQGVSPMDFFVRQNNEKKKVRETERQAAARVYKHNTYDKSMFE